MLSKDQIWLIKSVQKIKGPFHLEEIEALLDAKEVSLIDEIKHPNRRWIHLRNCPELQSWIEKQKNQIQIENEVTDTQTINSRTTQVILDENESYGHNAEETAETLSKKSLDVFSDQSHARIINSSSQIHDRDDQNKVGQFIQHQSPIDVETVGEVNLKSQKLKSLPELFVKEKYQMTSDGLQNHHNQNEAKNSVKKKLAQKTILVILCVVGLFLTFAYVYKTENQKKSFLNLVAEVKKNELWQRSEANIKIFSLQNDKNKWEILPYMIPLIPDLAERQFLDFNEAFNYLSNLKTLNVEQKLNLDLLKVFVLMKEKKYEAADATLNILKEKNAFNEKILEINAQLKFYNQQHDLAAAEYENLWFKFKRPRFLMGYFMSALSHDFKKNSVQLNKLNQESLTKTNTAKENLKDQNLNNAKNLFKESMIYDLNQTIQNQYENRAQLLFLKFLYLNQKNQITEIQVSELNNLLLNSFPNIDQLFEFPRLVDQTLYQLDYLVQLYALQTKSFQHSFLKLISIKLNLEKKLIHQAQLEFDQIKDSLLDAFHRIDLLIQIQSVAQNNTQIVGLAKNMNQREETKSNLNQEASSRPNSNQVSGLGGNLNQVSGSRFNLNQVSLFLIYQSLNEINKNDPFKKSIIQQIRLKSDLLSFWVMFNESSIEDKKRYYESVQSYKIFKPFKKALGEE